jgi:2-phosphosulfolactate phosphatase
MIYNRTNLDSSSSAQGVVVVIDVLRAFSTAAYAFAAGEEDIALVSSVEDAFELRKRIPRSILMGEVEGLPVEGFDFGNSPPQFEGIDLTGRHLIQRTTSGTQGAVRSDNADVLLAASFCNVGATISYIKMLSPNELTFIITGWRPGGWGDEDAACADYIEHILEGHSIEAGPYLDRVRDSVPGRMFTNPSLSEYPNEDLEYCLAIDRFNFAMPIHRQNGRFLMIAHPV